MAEELQLEPVDTADEPLHLEPVDDSSSVAAAPQPPQNGTFFTRLVSTLSKSMEQIQGQHAAEIEATNKALGQPLVTVPSSLVRTGIDLSPVGLVLSPEIKQGIAEGVAHVATGLTTPTTVGIGLAAIAQPEIVASVLGGLGAKSAGEKFGEASVAAQTGNKREAARLATEGTADAAMAILPAAGLAMKSLHAATPPIIKATELGPLDQQELNLDSPKAPGTEIKVPTTATPPIQSTTKFAVSPSGGSRFDLWVKGVVNEALPRMTTADNPTGELGVRALMANRVGREMGEIFAEKVLRDLNVDPKELGAFMVEDNLRSRRAEMQEQALHASDPADAAMLQQAADAVGTVVGAKGSPFANVDEWMAYADRPEVQEALSRHRDLWTEQKDPLFRQANDLDPEMPLASRGQISGARVNMKAIAEGETSPTAIAVHDTPEAQARVGLQEEVEPGAPYRPALIRQMATLKKKDPFFNRFTGLGHAYETDYVELMRHGFGREMPVAAQHQFLKSLVDSGNAVVTDNSYEPELTINGERTQDRLMTLRPWKGRYLQIPKSLVEEFDNVVGLLPATRLGFLKPISNFFTAMSTWGLGEGTTHLSNLMSRAIVGAGPTSNPLVNGLLKAASGRLDLLYTLPRVFVRALTKNREDMVDLMAIGAAKEPYKGPLGRLLLNPADKGVRLVASDLYKNFADAGWIEIPTETGRREFVNAVGNYNGSLQNSAIRLLRETGLQPFATAGHTFNVLGLRTMAGSAGLKGLTPAQRAAFAADIYGGVIGFVTALTGISYLLNRNDPRVTNPVMGPTGTKLGDIGWYDEHDKLHTFPFASMMGYARGPRLTGLLPAAEALHRGLPPSEALDAAGNALAQTGLNYVTGPLVRSLFVAATGKSPSIPSIQQTPPVPPAAPGDLFDPMKSRLVLGFATAAQQANPAIDAVLHGLETFTPLGEKLNMGPTKDIRKLDDVLSYLNDLGTKQLSRFYPREPSTIQASEDFADIVTKAHLNDYVDEVTHKARKLPEDQRADYVNNAIQQLPDDLQKSARAKLKVKGASKPDR